MSYTAPPGASAADLVIAQRAALYKPFTPTGNDDEFDDENFSGWTALQAAPTLTPTEENDRLSIKHPGGDAGAQFHAWVKAVTVASNDWIEIAFQQYGEAGNYAIIGLLFANGATYGAGSQYAVGFSPTENGFIRSLHSNYSSSGGAGSLGGGVPSANMKGALMIYRLMYEGSNVYRGYVSPDGINYVQTFTETSSHITSRTHMGFYVSTWGGTPDLVYSLLYARFGNGAPP